MINHVTLKGFVADEPFIKSTEFGRLARLRLATVEHLRSPRTGVEMEHIEWHTVSTFGECAILIDREVKIGTALHIEGSLRHREWQDRSGTTRKTIEIAATRVEILESIEGCEIPQKIRDLMPSTETKSEVPPPQYEVKAPADDADGLPF